MVLDNHLVDSLILVSVGHNYSEQQSHWAGNLRKITQHSTGLGRIVVFLLETFRVDQVSVCGDVSLVSNTVGKGKIKANISVWFMATLSLFGMVIQSVVCAHHSCGNGWDYPEYFKIVYVRKYALKSKVLLNVMMTFPIVEYAVWHCAATQWFQLAGSASKKNISLANIQVFQEGFIHSYAYMQLLVSLSVSFCLFIYILDWRWASNHSDNNQRC